jgi:hypothetical protein
MMKTDRMELNITLLECLMGGLILEEDAELDVYLLRLVQDQMKI